MFPRYLINPCTIKKIHDWYDCIVVGSGIAGLSTAIRISRHSKVKVLTKSDLATSTTWYAQGGIAAAVKKPDWWKLHYEDTMEAGQGLCDSVAVQKLVKSAPQMIQDLVELGIAFDISGGEISLTTEGGHSFPRVLHAGGDATGEEIEKKLVKYSGTFSNIDFYSGHLAVDLITDSNKILGIISFDIKNNVAQIHPCANVVIASGGIGQLYDISTNPSISTGDGIAMTWRAGASIKDIEFIQFHPTVFKTNDGHLFLITEALRGEGAFLRDRNGKRFMLGKHPRAELAPRDIVVKEMVKVMSEQNLHFIFLDATHVPDKLLKVRFPNIIAKLKENGLDLGTDLIKVFPAAHYLNGGIKTDLKGRTDIAGLYACGETSATGAHGANRLASNSLIEGLVFGWEISKDIIRKIKNKKEYQESRSMKLLKKAISACMPSVTKISPTSGQLQVAAGQPAKVNVSATSTPLVPAIAFPDKIDGLILGFRKMMSRKVGILRDEKSLKGAQQEISNILKKHMIFGSNDKKFLEFINMLNVGHLIAKAGLIRTESRGTHLRNDWPKRNDKQWKKHIILKGKDFHFEPVD